MPLLGLLSGRAPVIEVGSREEPGQILGYNRPASACNVWEDTRVRLRLLWFSQVRLTVSQWPDPVPPRGHAKGLGRVLVASFGKPG